MAAFNHKAARIIQRPVRVDGCVSNILAGERSGLLTRIAAAVNTSSCVRMIADGMNAPNDVTWLSLP